MLSSYFADLHIHVGRDMYGGPVKIAASKHLTITNVLKEASRRKGLDLVGVIDCHAPNVQEEILQLIHQGKAEELPEGGIQFEHVTLLLGSEIEIYDEHCQGPLHVLCYFKSLNNMKDFTNWLRDKMKNISLSSQRYYGTASALQRKVKELEGLFIPAHIFTPFKSSYGKGVKTSMSEVFDMDLIDAVELGLSADNKMADNIRELHSYPYVTNSDSHSLAKIAREYQKITLASPSFTELKKALRNEHGRRIEENYGMSPKLGKYYTTVCQKCLKAVSYETKICPHCHSKKIVTGVYDRIQALKDATAAPNNRPEYFCQVPLEYLPGIGKKTFDKLIASLGTEMAILHYSSKEALEEVLPAKLVDIILAMRNGDIQVQAGGGGNYGRLLISDESIDI